uniref:Uncharacterized protein n=1 Tax=Parascaris equorum TaxID=6256 RepID=A0A914S200_PAREQ
LLSTWKQLRKDRELLEGYDAVFSQQKGCRVIDELSREELKPTSNNVHYLLHKVVIRPYKTTTKIRVVFDGFSRSRGTKSVNEAIMRRPILHLDLGGILLRFRLRPIAIIGGLEKAFLHMALNKPDRDATLWSSDINSSPTHSNLKSFALHESRLQLKQVIAPRGNDQKSLLTPKKLEQLRTTEKAFNKFERIKKLFEGALINIREFLSNNAVSNKTIPRNDRHEAANARPLGLR